jgi:hypothetical protein
MNNYGASSVLFQLRIQRGGYGVAAKAARSDYFDTDRDMSHRLQREEAVYRKLCSIQGRFIPTCLGMVKTPQETQASSGRMHGPIDIRRFSVFLLLSWAGASLLGSAMDMDRDARRAWSQRIKANLATAPSSIHGLGVLHGDAELRNFEIPHNGTVSLVDFERSTSRGSFIRRLIKSYPQVKRSRAGH